MKQKRVLIVIFLAILVAVFVAAAVVEAAFPRDPGQIELSATEYDFGTIPNTGPVSQDFQVRNTGDGPLEIGRVTTSCGCTTAEISSRRLAPDETADLTVTYDPQAHGGATGKFMRIVYVQSSDPDTPEVNLSVQVTVVEP